MKFRIVLRSGLLYFSFLILACIGATGYVVYQSNQKLITSANLVQHTEQILSQLSEITSLGKDIESSCRGFMLTNDSSFLEPLLDVDSILIVKLAELRRLTRENARQHARADSLATYARRRLDLALTLIRKRRTGDTFVDAFKTTSNFYAEKTQKLNNAIRGEEVSLLALRKIAKERNEKSLYQWFVIILVFIGTFTVLLLVVTVNYFNQNKEKEVRAADLVVANRELAFQNREKENRASELITANQELQFQNIEKENRAAELIVANKELAFQNEEKEKRAAELIIANNELAFQNLEKEKRAEELTKSYEALIYQNGRLSFFIENTPLGFVEWDQNSLITSWSSRAEEIFGWTQHELLKTKGLRLRTIVDEDIDAVGDILGQLQRGEVTRNRVQLRSNSKDGRVIWSEWFNSVLKDSSGSVITIMSLVQDITERKEAENHLRLLESVIINANDAVLITKVEPVNQNTSIVYVNNAFTTMTGYSAAEAAGKTRHLLEGPGTDHRVLDMIAQCMDRGESSAGEVLSYTKNGKEFWNSFTIVPIVSKGGHLTHWVSIQRDVTARRRLEETTRLELERLVVERTSELNEALMKEKDLVELKSKFVSIASHEFRTPLSTISFAAESIRNYFNKLSEDEIRRKLIKIEDQAHHMTNLLEDILTLGKSDAGKIKVKKKKLDLKEFIKSLIEEVTASVKEKRIVDFTFSCATSDLVADDQLLRNVVINLMTNALKFSVAPSVVRISLSDKNDQLLLEVSDNGIGIDAAELSSIFESFQRGSNVSSIQGSGLGLSILKRAVLLMGGTIDVQSTLGQGSKFSVQIPSS